MWRGELRKKAAVFVRGLTQFKAEICYLIASITGSHRVCWVTTDEARTSLICEACTLGQMGSYDIKYDLPILGLTRPVLLVPEAKLSAEFSVYPGSEIVPNFHSLAAFLIRHDETAKTFIVAWNPLPKFFKNDEANALIERIIGVCQNLEQDWKHGIEDGHTRGAIGLASLGMQERFMPFHAEPISKFLFDTLVKRQRLLARNDVTYLAVRQWRKSIKPFQIKALEALKSDEYPTVADAIGLEIVETVSRMYDGIFQGIVPIPGGSSGKERPLSVLVAEVVARNLNVPLRNVLVGGPVERGASHPKKSARMPDYKLNGDVSGRLLVIDDVATSGRHLELAIKALRPQADFVAGISWIANSEKWLV